MIHPAPVTSSTASYTADQIAEYFLHKGKLENKGISNKKLQKLLYYAQAWFLVVRKKKLFKERIEAWVHGPAVRNIYFQYKKFGFNRIEKEIEIEKISDISNSTKKFLDEIWRVYGGLDAAYLELLTHSEKPWIEAREGVQESEKSEKIISLKTMKSFYTEKLKKTRK